MLIYQYRGSGSELRKSSVSSKGVHLSGVCCEMFWSSSSRKKVAHIDKSCRTWRAFDQLGCGAETLCQGWIVETVWRPQHHIFDWGVSSHWSSISSIWRLGGTLSTSTAKELLSSSNLHFWTPKLANRQLNSMLSTTNFSENCTHGNTVEEICGFMVWQQGKWPTLMNLNLSLSFGISVVMRARRQYDIRTSFGALCVIGKNFPFLAAPFETHLGTT